MPEADDSALASVMIDLVDYFMTLDDSGDAVFGECARVSQSGDTLLIGHESEPWGIEITFKRIDL